MSDFLRMESTSVSTSSDLGESFEAHCAAGPKMLERNADRESRDIRQYP